MNVNYNGNVNNNNYNNNNNGFRPLASKNCGYIYYGRVREVLDRNKPYPLVKKNLTIKFKIDNQIFVSR